MSYLHLGKGLVADTADIVGIFDLDITSQSHLTRKFLAASEKAGEVSAASEDLPKSFVVCERDGKRTLVLSQMSAATLRRRVESGDV